jgi:hypothetical protein
MNDLTSFEIGILRQCAAGTDIKSSDRPSDRAKTKLKNRGYLKFDRTYWKWMLTIEGHAFLHSHDWVNR